ncbi:GNAT family N-acetyltransferase [Xaviernesmea oryzae]|uniref:GNAT family N-acetyltransferase n=1 Tax=Xaviernesmea oryzae TaxID=464029 RepID=A0A1Q9AUK8_9HYPH|nr:GNAT family N-acetyltransferase [Xaviernesmea oryzae]OLP59088.1 GNAT family N-acetyltransferase [Xaviernesmea oryzae]SEK87276.1 Ribosomal protein S18 acetylase RimI [Xaviernesmea oryzae]
MSSPLPAAPQASKPGLRRLSAEAAIAALPELADILLDCIEGGASVGFMADFSRDEAEAYWRDVAAGVASGATLLLAAEQDGRLAGTVQLGLKQPPNQPHRADLKKLLVHRTARGLGFARLLLDAAEAEAGHAGKSLLVLDTATGSPAEAIYARLGWSPSGIIPNYALWPDGRFCDTTIFYKAL